MDKRKICQTPDLRQKRLQDILPAIMVPNLNKMQCRGDARLVCAGHLAYMYLYIQDWIHSLTCFNMKIKCEYKNWISY